MEGDSMQLWVLSSRQHLRERLIHTHTRVQTEGGIGTNLSLSSVAYIIVLRWSWGRVSCIQSDVKVIATRTTMYHNVTPRCLFSLSLSSRKQSSMLPCRRKIVWTLSWSITTWRRQSMTRQVTYTCSVFKWHTYGDDQCWTRWWSTMKSILFCSVSDGATHRNGSVTCRLKSIRQQPCYCHHIQYIMCSDIYIFYRIHLCALMSHLIDTHTQINAIFPVLLLSLCRGSLPSSLHNARMHA